ncbi:hypothetical protein B0T17DRAFT_593861 [Bombardia bombarda]|uniref:NodB homology domain-containing protein n=1 Tax=Bombardia bombarda TaxID=252184 RepID=A0AA39WAE0_9PEZI|nr:hypothetical protein B0T17DRAFT_593861 [Bombardia bombarda]
MTAPPTTTRWPNGARAAISFTMDNLGEAQDVNRGVWTAPIGTHPSITNQLPRMLDLLDTYNIKATYFIESWSLDVYPAAVAEIGRRGHELAWHSYQHEVWSQLSAEDEALNIQKSFDAAAKHGITYAGFRPPGGTVNERTWALLRERGLRYLSPLGELGIGPEGLVVLPFEWQTVDAHYYMGKFAALRQANGLQVETLSPGYFRDYLVGKIEEVKRTGGYISILFHPMLQDSEEKFAMLEEVLKRLSGEGDIWLAPCDEVARWVTEHKDAFEGVKDL